VICLCRLTYCLRCPLWFENPLKDQLNPAWSRNSQLTPFRVSFGTRTTINGKKTWRTSWGCDPQLTPFRVQLGYQYDQKWWEGLKTILGSWPSTYTFQGLTCVPTRPQVVRRHEGHLGVVTPNWHLSGSTSCTGMPTTGEKTTILVLWLLTDTFWGPAWVPAWPQVVRRHEGYLGVVTPNWCLWGSILGTGMTTSGKKTWRPSWGRDP